LLLEKGANINSPPEDRECPLILALEQNNFQIVSQLLCKGALSDDVFNIRGETPLTIALRQKTSECLECLVEKNPRCSLELRRICESALRAACQAGNESIVAFLLRTGFIDQKDEKLVAACIPRRTQTHRLHVDQEWI